MNEHVEEEPHHEDTDKEVDLHENDHLASLITTDQLTTIFSV